MTNDELNKARAFLNEKQIPTLNDLTNLFFHDKQKPSLEMDDEFNPDEIDYDLLGEADEVRTEAGTEWVATQLIWYTTNREICRINLLKISQPLNNTSPISFIPSELNMQEIIDIEHQEVISEVRTYIELLDEAIEDENFEEAARLRDWDAGLKKLLITLKPKIIEAIETQDVDVLDSLLTEIRSYRATL